MTNLIFYEEFLKDSCGAMSYIEYLEERLLSTTAELKKFEDRVVACPECKRKIKIRI